MPLDIATRQALINATRDAARAEIMPRFRRLAATEIDTKSGAQDLVTAADRGAEAHMRAAFAAILPEARLIGEEGVAANPGELDALSEPGLAIVIDPVDGTWNFAHGLANFGSIVAVIENGVTIFGLLYDPVLDDWVEATKGEGTWFVAGSTRRRLNLGSPPLHGELTGLHSAYGLDQESWLACAALHTRFGRVTSLRASLWDYRTLVTGGTAFALNRYLNVWDHAAGVLALTEAGGHAALLDGQSYVPTLREGFLLCAQSETIWHEVAELFAPALMPEK